MGYYMRAVAVALVLSISSLTFAAPSVTIAYDDAADPVYNTGPYVGLNGGFGLTPWQHSPPVGPLHAFVSTSALNGPPGPDIDTAGSFGPVAWGNNADPTGNTFFARRSLAFDLPVGGTLGISYDGGNVDGQQTLSFGLNNNTMCQFFFNASFPNYQFTDTLSSATLPSPILQTFGGMRVTLTRDTASTYSFEMKRLSDNLTFSVGPFPYDTTTITGIRTITLSNLDGGAGGGHSMFLNQIQATMIPEPATGSLLTLVTGLIVSRRPTRPRCSR
jgi:hypothetical protein